MSQDPNRGGGGPAVAEAGTTVGAAVKNIGWRVTCAGVGINLALGILYSWSVIKGPMMDKWHWSKQEAGWPYSIACLIFALLMVPAGWLQDKAGPRLAATIGGLLVGGGMILAGLCGHYWGAESYWGYIVGFGVLAGAGIGFGYAAATPPAVKWFPARRTGMIAGIVVGGFGLASVYAAPLTTWLLEFRWGIPGTTMILGGAFLVVVVGLAQLLAAPPKGYVPAGSAPGPRAGTPAAAPRVDFTPGEVCGTWQLYLLWFLYFCGAGAGLMIIANLKPLASEQIGLKLGFILVAALGVGNGAGRVLAGTLSDKLGRQRTLCCCFLLQAVLMIVLTTAQKGSGLANMPALALLSALIGANYGANLAIFPALTKDYYGLKSFGLNYGLVFTAWGVGGFALSKLQDVLCDKYHSYVYSCYTAAALLVLAALLSFLLRKPAR